MASTLLDDASQATPIFACQIIKHNYTSEKSISTGQCEGQEVKF